MRIIVLCLLLCGCWQDDQYSTPLTVLASGQSNMCGRGPGGPSPVTADRRVTVWNNENELGEDGTEFISPPDFGNAPWGIGRWEGANNLAVWFADKAAKELERRVNLVLVCKGGRGLDSWDIDQDVYHEILNVYRLSNSPPADYFLWHQGDLSFTWTKEEYRESFLGLIDNLKSDGILSENVQVIAGGLARDEAEHINELFRELSEEYDYIHFASAEGLETMDGVHFTGESLYKFGPKYWHASR